MNFLSSKVPSEWVKEGMGKDKKKKRKRCCLSPKKGDSEEVDTAPLFQSWAGDMDLVGKRSS